MKKCWKCAEEIQDEAIACRFCNADQPQKSTASGDQPTKRPFIEYGPKREGPAKNSFQSCMGCLGVVVIGFFVLMAIGSVLPDPSPEPSTDISNTR